MRDASGRLIPSAVEHARREAAELSNRLISGERLSREPREVTLGELIWLFRREVMPHQALRTREDSDRQLDLLANYLGEGFAVTRFDTATWNELRRGRADGRVDAHGKVVEKPEHRVKVGPRTVAKTLKFLRQLFRFGANYRLPDGKTLLDNDPTRGLHIPVERDPKRPLLDEDRYDKLLSAARSDMERALYIAARYTGRRISSILALTWDDWRPDEGMYGVLRWQGAHDKLGRTSTVPVTEAVRDALNGSAHTSQYIFPHPSNPARPLPRQWAHNWLRATEYRAKLEHLPSGGFHMFRRLWATEREGLSLKDVAYAGGWKDTTTLLGLYQQPDADTLQQVVDGGMRGKLRAVQ